MATEAASSSTPSGYGTGIGNLIRLLPTGTLFFYQFMNPILTNNGVCSASNKYIYSVLFAGSALICFFSTFTDSYHDSQGNIHYGFPTFNGFWTFSSSDDDDARSPPVNFRSYRIQFGDFVHAFLSLTIFCVLCLLDSNTVHCLYPSFEETGKSLMMALPPVIGSVAATVVCSFPIKRHSIGYPATSPPPQQPSSSSSSSTSTTVELQNSQSADQKA